LIYTIT